MSRKKIKLLRLHFHRTNEHQTWDSGDLVWGALTCLDKYLWSFGHVMSRDKIKSLYLHLHRNYKHQMWYSVDLGWGASTLIDHSVMWCYMTINMLYLIFHRTCKHESWRIGDLGWGVPTDQVTCPFDHARWQRGPRERETERERETHTETETQRETQRQRHRERDREREMSDTSPFSKTTPLFYQHLPFYGKPLNLSFFLEISITEPPFFVTRECSNYACSHVISFEC